MRLFNLFSKKNMHQEKTNEENTVNPPCSAEKRAAGNSDQAAAAGQQNGSEPNAGFSAPHQSANKKIDLIRLVIAHCSKLLAEAETGGRQAFAISGTENVGVLDLKDSRYPVGEWTARIGVVRNGTDWMVSNYLWTGSRDEVVSQMLAEAGQKEILDAVLALSDRVDQHWNE